MSKMTLEEINSQRFQTLLPFYNWDNQVEYCLNLNEWSNDRAVEGVRAIEILREFYGENFPESALKKDHGIGRFLCNNVRWAKESLIWLANCIVEMKPCVGFEKIDYLLRSSEPGEFEDALINLEFGKKFKRQGVEVEFESPVLSISGEITHPDLRVIDQDLQKRELYVENCRLLSSDLSNVLGELSNRIIHTGFQHGKWLKFSIALHRRVGNAEIATLKAGITDLARRSLISEGLQEWIQPGLITAAVAGFDDPALTEWANANNMEVNACYLPGDAPFRRIGNKIQHKANQLPVNFPTLLIIKIEDDALFGIPIEECVNDVKGTLKKCPSVSAVLLTIHHFGGINPSISKIGENFAFRKNERYALASESLLIFNEYSLNPLLTKDEWELLLENFR